MAGLLMSASDIVNGTENLTLGINMVVKVGPIIESLQAVLASRPCHPWHAPCEIAVRKP